MDHAQRQAGAVYGLADGSSQIVESDDDFKAWEAEHILSSAPAGR